jgi:hypothetical protein
MIISEFISELQKYPQDMKISFGEDSDWSESVILIFGQAEKGETINHGYGYTSTNLIVKFDQYTEKITWSDPKTFKRNFDVNTLVDDLSGAIILQKDMTGAEVLDAYLNGVHTIPINLNKEIKNDIQSN